MVPSLVKILKSVVSYGYSPEYDVSGITDPFLQVKILRVLRLLGEDDATASDQMNDLLAQIATNTDPLKNVGNAILYECVNTIMSIKSEDGLRVLAVNILGRFLSNRDNNIRYVALNTLCKVVNIDTDAVQRHRNTIVDCLKDNDISIRRRALELIYSLVNESNVRVLVRELINFLLVADVEFRSDLTAKLCMVTEKFAPTPRWRIDTILKVMSIAGAYVPDVVASNLVALISGGGSDLHTYAVQKMYLALSEDITQQSLVQVAVWCLGEFGELLLRSTAISLEDAGSQTLSVGENDVIAVLSKILRAPTSKTSTKRYILTAIVKLTARFSAQSQQQLKGLLLEFKQHLNVELQQRSIEFSQIASLDNIKSNLLARMPAPELKHDAGAVVAPATPSVTSALGMPSTGGVDLLDLMDLNLSPAAPSGAPVATNPLAGLGGPATTAPTSGNDLLAQLFGPSAPGPSAPAVMSGLTPTAPVTTPSFPTMNPSSLLTPVPAGMDGSLLTPLSGVGQTWPPINVLDAPEDGLSVVFDVSKPQPQNPQFTLIVATITNRGSMSLTDFEMKCAVPNYLKLVLLPASNTLIAPNNSVKVTQQIKIANSAQGQKPVKLKLRFDYKVGGSPRTREIPPLDLPAGV
jgi:AP-1 complex subunit gamma-1